MSTLPETRNGYPTEETLVTIRNWDVIMDGYEPLLEFVAKQWWKPNWGWYREGIKYEISTGGWSGNESLIVAMNGNVLFWDTCWVSSRRGGHYEFELPLR